MTTDNIVYLIGDKDIDKSLVLKSLGLINEITTDIQYKINTKYYTSNINIQNVNLNDNDDTVYNHNKDGHGIILVFDSLKPNSFNQIKSYIDKNKKKIPTTYNDKDNEDEDNENEKDEEDIDDTLYILIDINKSSSNSIENQVEEWCLSNLIEWVILDTQSHRDYDIRKSEITEIDEKIKYGVERLIEILESNMWPNMKLKVNNNKKNNNVPPQQQEDIDLDELSIKDNKILQDSLKKLEGFFNFKQSDPSSKSSSKKNNDNNNKSNVNVNGLSISEPIDKDDIDEDDDDPIQMEATFKELQQLREQLKDLPDDQRRAMAAKVAMMFASSMNFNDDG